MAESLTSLRVVTVLVAVVMAAGCNRAAPAVPAPAVTQASWEPTALEELLAPIALYPDVLLGQILAASVNAQEVLDGGNWLLENQKLKGDALDSAAVKAGFGPAMRALFQFPTVVDMMCQQIDWTRQLGAAFTSDQKGVLDAVQRLRAQAAAAGTLKSSPQQTVVQKKEGDTVVVEVKPANPQVVYVPQYDPQVVYAPPPPPPKADDPDTVSTDAAVAGRLLAFGVGVVLGNALDDDDYCYPHWGAGVMYYGPRPFYPPAYVYRPVYGSGLRPAHHYNNINVKRNVVIDNDQYFNRFKNDQNLRVNPQNRQAAATQPRESWKGQSSYAGTRDARANTGSQGTPAQRANAAGTQPRPDASRASTTQRIDRGYGASSTSSARESAGARESGSARDGGGLRDGGTAQGSGGTRSSGGTRDSAWAGASQPDASFDRAASARGRASTGGRALGGGRRR